MSKFDKVFEAREEKQQDKESGDKPVAKNSSVKSKTSKPAKQHESSSPITVSEQSSPVAAAESSKTEKHRGRPKAKRSDPAFIGFTTYIRKDTHLKVKIALLQEGEGREMSELVEDLLSNWTKNK